MNDPTPTEPRLLVNGNDSEYKVNMSGKKKNTMGLDKSERTKRGSREEATREEKQKNQIKF